MTVTNGNREPTEINEINGDTSLKEFLRSSVLAPNFIHSATVDAVSTFSYSPGFWKRRSCECLRP